MRISAIKGHYTNQSRPYSSKVATNVKSNQPEKPQVEAPAFKGGGTGGLLGLGAGLVTGLIIIGGAAITGGLALPALIGGAGIVASGAGGAYIGDKIEDKITGEKKE